MASVQLRLADDVSCRVTAFDFTGAAASRLLFPHVEVTTAPEKNGASDVQAIDAIKRNIAYLHARVLGEELETTDPEIGATYDLFYGTWKELIQAGDSSLPGPCQATKDITKDATTGVDFAPLPAGSRYCCEGATPTRRYPRTPILPRRLARGDRRTSSAHGGARLPGAATP